MGILLAVLVLQLGKFYSVMFFGVSLGFGLFISSLFQKGVQVPIFSWFLQRFERKEAWPGKGAIYFFLGSFLAVIFFDPYYVFVSILILAFLDSFSTIFGMGFGKRKAHKKKTWEGSIAGFSASFLVSLLFLPFNIAFGVCLVATVLEMLALVDDNILIPPVASFVIWFMARSVL